MKHEKITPWFRAYTEGCIEKRYAEIESERAELNSKSEPCYFMRGGKWDTPLEELKTKLKEIVLKTAENEYDAATLVDAIFGKMSVYISDTGGDHHSGYFMDYSVSTKDALSLAEDTSEMQKIMEAARPKKYHDREYVVEIFKNGCSLRKAIDTDPKKIIEEAEKMNEDGYDTIIKVKEVTRTEMEIPLGSLKRLADDEKEFSRFLQLHKNKS